jgi:hypothetical protein
VADAGFFVLEDLFGGQGIGRGWQHGMGCPFRWLSFVGWVSFQYCTRWQASKWFKVDGFLLFSTGVAEVGGVIGVGWHSLIVREVKDTVAYFL